GAGQRATRPETSGPRGRQQANRHGRPGSRPAQYRLPAGRHQSAGPEEASAHLHRRQRHAVAGDLRERRPTRAGDRPGTVGSGQPDPCHLRPHRAQRLTDIPMPDYLLAIDQGTTSSRAMIFDQHCRPLQTAQQEFAQHFPQDGWVEHDPEDIWQSVVSVVRNALQQAGLAATDICGIGITNQRETTLVWNAETGQAIYPAIVWQDRRTAAYCDQLREQGHEALISERTGLLIAPYFSATKLRWILDQVPGARQQAEQGQLRFGTVDSFLLWRLTGGRVHRTDATNASRTLLFNIHTQQWDQQLLELMDIPASLLPEVLDNTADFGHTDPSLFGAPIPVAAMAGDQQAALVGQACVSPGSVKSTYGTGCFMVMNTGDTPVRSAHRLLTTVAYRLDGKPTYALEGSIFVAGAAIQWLRDGLRLISHADETEALAEQVGDQSGVY